ncbi:MAG: transporter [Pedobacter sp.]
MKHSLAKVLFTVAFAIMLGGVGSSFKANAGIIPNSVIVPHEYQFPPAEVIPDEGFSGLLSYNIYREEGVGWDGETGTRSLFATVNKLFHVFDVDGVDNVGFAAEALFGYGRVLTKNDQSLNGLLDVQVGMVAFMKPTDNWTTALEYWLVLPIGDEDFSGHSWDQQFAFLTNYVYGDFTFDGDVGYKLRGESKHDGLRSQGGDVIYASACWGYKFANMIEPFFKLDYMTVDSGKDKNTGLTIPSSSELTWGVGNFFKINDNVAVSLHYIKGLTGRNTSRANGVEFNLYWVF